MPFCANNVIDFIIIFKTQAQNPVTRPIITASTGAKKESRR